MVVKWVLLLLHILSLYSSFGSEIVVQVNTKKWIYYVPERFLSLSVDPLTLAAASPLTQESYNMAKGLSPSFVRIGGIGTNALIFGKEFMVNSSTVSESQWDSVNDFARGTGLDIIASLNPSIQVQGVWDSQNSLELISYSNKKRHSVVWQLGYDVRGYNASGAEIGRDLVRLAKILDGFPTYAGSPVFSPDISSVSGAKQIHFVKDLLTNAGNSLGSVILQPGFMNDDAPEDPYELITSMTNELDTYVWNKEARVGKVMPKKPVWIAEPTASKGSFGEAKKLVKRLGISARIGIQIYMRQAGALSLKTPTPEFWFSLLYKNLVGQGVLDNKIVSQNQSDLHVFAHCSASVPQDRSVLDTDWNYEKGAVTLFGVNESPEAVKLVLKVTSKEEPLHIYVLTSDMKNERGDNPRTLLNGQELVLSPTWDLPVLSPKVKRPSKSASVILPGDSIFFIVVPDSKIRTCSVPPLATPDLNLSELTKRLRLTPTKKSETLGEEEEIEPADDVMSEGVYVTFVKKKRHDAESKNYNSRAETIGKNLMQTIISKLAPKKIDMKTSNRPINNEEMPIYITFNENSFLNKLAEGVKEELKEEDQQEFDYKNDKYAPLTAAIKSIKPESSSAKPAGMSDESDVIKIQLEVENSSTTTVQPDQETKEEPRKRRSSNEEPPPGSASLKDIDPMEIIKKITECKRIGTAMDGEVRDVAHSLDHVTVSVTNPAADSAISDKTRTARHIGDAAEEASDRGTVQSTCGDAKNDEVREKEKIKDRDDDEDVAKKTSALVKVVQETEKAENVSEMSDGVVVPPGVSEKNIDKIMLETAKSKSEPEPNSDNSPEQETSSTGNICPSKDKGSHLSIETGVQPSAMVMPAVTEESSGLSLSNDHAYTVVPVSLQPSIVESTSSGQPNEPVVTNSDSTKRKVLQGSQITSNPIIIVSQPIQEHQIIPTASQIKDNHILKIPFPSPPQNAEPNIMFSRENNLSPMPSTNPSISFYNEQKESAINKILAKMVNEEDKLANVTPDSAKLGVMEGGSDSHLVAVPLSENDTILMASEDVKMINQGGGTSEIRTLVNDSIPIELGNEDEEPRVKVARQVKTSNTVRIAVTPLSQTATLSAPVEEATTTTTTTPAGPVSPFKSTVDSNSRTQINQIRETLKAPSPEELRERFKSLREKMIELRSQYLAAREKRLADMKKQVASRGPSPSSEADDAIKSSIKRREAELKEWFKKFDKRETQTSPIVVPLEDGMDVKPRPRRLSLFSNNEGFDMEKFFEEEPSESYNYKRSPEVSSQNGYQSMVSDARPTLPKTVGMGKHIFPLDTKTHGIVYNNKIYPAKLFGYIDQPDLENEKVEPAENGVPKSDDKFEGQIKDTKTSEEIPKSRERIVFVPRDAFTREIKSDFIPVIVIPPDESEDTKTDDLYPARAKRSTLGSLEDQFHQLKEDLLPKISSWIKNLSEKSPWKRDLEGSSRSRRSIDDVLRTNDLRSLLVPKMPRKTMDNMSTKLIEDFVVTNVDKGENEIYATAKKYGSLAEKIGDQVLNKVKRQPNNQHNKIENEGYCEEIGTSKESIIRDPFDNSVLNTSNVGKTKIETQSDSNPSSLDTCDVKIKQKSDKAVVRTPVSSLDIEESVFPSVIAEKISNFFNTIKNLIEVSSAN